jgi:hypothetical protein
VVAWWGSGEGRREWCCATPSPPLDFLEFFFSLLHTRSLASLEQRETQRRAESTGGPPPGPGDGDVLALPARSCVLLAYILSRPLLIGAIWPS